MSREIEAKIPLTKEEFVNLLKLIMGLQKKHDINCSLPTLVFKSDEYYSQYDDRKSREENEPRVIRIRTEKEENDFIEVLRSIFASCEDNSVLYQQISDFVSQKQDVKSKSFKAFFCTKVKRIENGIELNEEHETFIQDADVLRAFFAFTKFKCWFKKQKIAFGAICTSASSNNLEFHLELEIVNNLPYIEIEYTKPDCDADFIKENLKTFFTELNLDFEKKDKRSWVEIIGLP